MWACDDDTTISFEQLNHQLNSGSCDDAKIQDLKMKLVVNFQRINHCIFRYNFRSLKYLIALCHENAMNQVSNPWPWHSTVAAKNKPFSFLYSRNKSTEVLQKRMLVIEVLLTWSVPKADTYFTTIWGNNDSPTIPRTPEIVTCNTRKKKKRGGDWGSEKSCVNIHWKYHQRRRHMRQ